LTGAGIGTPQGGFHRSACRQGIAEGGGEGPPALASGIAHRGGDDAFGILATGERRQQGARPGGRDSRSLSGAGISATQGTFDGSARRQSLAEGIDEGFPRRTAAAQAGQRFGGSGTAACQRRRERRSVDPRRSLTQRLTSGLLGIMGKREGSIGAGTAGQGLNESVAGGAGDPGGGQRLMDIAAGRKCRNQQIRLRHRDAVAVQGVLCRTRRCKRRVQCMGGVTAAGESIGQALHQRRRLGRRQPVGHLLEGAVGFRTAGGEIGRKAVAGALADGAVAQHLDHSMGTVECRLAGLRDIGPVR
jgi:hypothetical protein